MGFANNTKATFCSNSPRRGDMFIAISNTQHQKPRWGEINIIKIHLRKTEPAPLIINRFFID